MILNFDRGNGQTAEQMIQSLMESTQMALDNLARQIGITQPNESTTVVQGEDAASYPVGSVVVLGTECYTYGVDNKGCTDTTRSTGSSYDTLGNPSDILGIDGEWELVDKNWGSTYSEEYSSFAKRNTTNTTSIDSGGLYRNGKNVHINLGWTNKTAHSDTTRELLTLQLDKIGVSALTSGITRSTGYSDVANGMAYLSINSSGVVSEVDFISRAASIPTTTGDTMTMSADFIVRMSQMYDAHCNLFYWKRIA